MSSENLIFKTSKHLDEAIGFWIDRKALKRITVDEYSGKNTQYKLSRDANFFVEMLQQLELIKHYPTRGQIMLLISIWGNKINEVN